MANQWDVDDYDDDNDTNQQGQQPQLPNAARKRMRELEKQLKEANDKLAEQAKAARTATVAKQVEDKGYDPSVAALVPEGVEVDAWLDQYSAVLVKKTPEAASGSTPEPTPDPEEAAIEAAWAKLVGATSTATPGGAPGKIGDLMGLMKATDNPEALDKLLKGVKVPISM